MTDSYNSIISDSIIQSDQSHSDVNKESDVPLLINCNYVQNMYEEIKEMREAKESQHSQQLQQLQIQTDRMEQEKKRTTLEIQKRIKARGLSGIGNRGNTCYMNASLQALCATPPLRAYLLYEKSELLTCIERRIVDNMFIEHEKSENSDNPMEIVPHEITCIAKRTLTYKLKNVFKHMWAHNCEVNPKQFKKGVDKGLTFFGGTVQHDSQEFSTALLDKIHEETKSSTISVIKLTQKTADIEQELLALDELLAVAKHEKNTYSVKDILSRINKLYTNNKDEYIEVRAIVAWIDIIKSSYSIINDIFSGMTMTEIVCDECKLSNHIFERFDIMTISLPVLDISLIEPRKSTHLGQLTTISDTGNHPIPLMPIPILETSNSYTLEDLLKTNFEDEVMKNETKYQCGYCEIKKSAIKHHIVYQLPNILVIMFKKYQRIDGEIKKAYTRVNYGHKLDMTPYVSENNKKQKIYELYAVIRHAGGYGGGHYYSYIKNSLNNLWYLCDDGDIYNVEEDEPLRANGYVLFYKQIQQ
jgi:ubiquitin C-terminal hydrolase